MPELSPESTKWLRKLRLALTNHGAGIQADSVPLRVKEELQKAGKIHIDKGQLVYTVQLTEKLDPKNRKWIR